MGIAVETAFGWAGLTPRGPVAWEMPFEERQPGIYVVALSESINLSRDAIELRNLPPHELAKWVPGERIVYIGRTKRGLQRRLREFYRHTYGARSPHRGGQAVLLLSMPRFVYWAATDHSTEAEHSMIEHFKAATDQLPFANRKRGWRTSLEQV